MAQLNNRAGAIDFPAVRDTSATVCCSTLADLLSPRLFKALADPKRLFLLVRLAERGDACTVSQAAEGSGVDLSVVSRHLAILRDAGVITCQKRGKEVWCTVRTGAVAHALRDLADALEACCPDGQYMVRQTDSRRRRGPPDPLTPQPDNTG
jgi:DNA-binding transcriptional ArsR family regulator